MQNQFDLIVLGGGSGGLAVAQRAASYGASVLVIEQAHIGGTCVNLGCVPKKMTWYAAELLDARRYSADYGFSHCEANFDFKTFVTRRDAYLRHLNAIYAKRLEKNQIQYLQGAAHFTDPHTISVNHKSYKAKKIVIATGSYPNRPNIKGSEFGIVSDDFFALKKLPKTIAIIGAGYIAVELACMLNQFGVKVKLVLRHDKLLRNFDYMLGDTLQELMIEKGIEFLTWHETTEINKDQDGHYTLICEHDKKVTHLDEILFAIGRNPCSQELNLAAAKVHADAHGFITVDEWEATNVPHIFAIGDVTGKKMLTPVAIAAGRRLADRIFGNKKEARLDYELVPSVVFTHPPIGTVGMAEHEAIAKYGKDNIKIHHAEFKALFYALSEHKVPTKMKLVTLESSGKILGCHVIGMGADEMLQGFAVAIKMGATKQDFDRTVAIHPTSAEEFVTM